MDQGQKPEEKSDAPALTEEQKYEQDYSHVRAQIDELELQNEVDLKFAKNYVYAFQSKEYSASKSYCLLGESDPKTEELFTKIGGIKAKLNENFYVDVNAKVGGHFPIIREVKSLFADETVTIRHKAGEVLLLDIWATWCSPCQKPMAHNQEMLEKNKEKWAGKVRIIGLSVDEEREDVIKRVEEKNWKLVEHYKIPGGWDPKNDAIKYFKHSGIPFVCLTDKTGLIVYRGHPSSTDLEEKINQLLEASGENPHPESTDQEKAAESQKKPKEKSVQAGEFQLIQQFLDKENGEFSKKINQIPEISQFTGYFQIDLQEQKQYHQKAETTSYTYAISYQVPVKELALIQAIKQIIAEHFKDTLKLDFYKSECVIDPLKDARDKVSILSTKLAAEGIKSENLLVPAQKIDLQLISKDKFQFTKNQLEITQGEKIQMKIEYCEKLQTLYKNLPKIESELEAAGKSPDLIDEIIYHRFQTTCLGSKQFPFKNISELKSKEKQTDVVVEPASGAPMMVCLTRLCDISTSKFLSELNQAIKDSKEAEASKSLFVVLLIDQEEDQINQMIEMIEKNKLDQIKFYRFNSLIWDEPWSKYFYTINYLPTIVGVNAEGNVFYYGKEKGIKLDEFIKAMATGDELPSEKQKKDLEKVRFTSEQHKKLKAVLKEIEKDTELKEFLGKVPYQIQFSFSYEKIRSFEADGTLSKSSTYRNAEISLQLREKDLLVTEKLILAKIYSVIPAEHVTKRIEKINCIDVPLGQECVTCKAKLDENTPHYWCKFTKEHLCVKCGEAEDETKQGIERFQYPHNLVYINIQGKLDLLKEIDEYKFGVDAQPAIGDKADQNPVYSCNGGCKKPTKGVRHICLTCRPGPMQPGGFQDYCIACETALRDKTHERHEEVAKNCEGESHFADHLRLRILFNVGGYYDF